jgi:hypothetical protein
MNTCGFFSLQVFFFIPIYAKRDSMQSGQEKNLQGWIVFSSYFCFSFFINAQNIAEIV